MAQQQGQQGCQGCFGDLPTQTTVLATKQTIDQIGILASSGSRHLAQVLRAGCCLVTVGVVAIKRPLRISVGLLEALGQDLALLRRNLGEGQGVEAGRLSRRKLGQDLAVLRASLFVRKLVDSGHQLVDQAGRIGRLGLAHRLLSL